MLLAGPRRRGSSAAVGLFFFSVIFSACCQPLGSDQDVELLTEGKPIVGFLDANEARIIRFGVTSTAGGEFPDILISLIVTNPLGDADLLCTPYNWVREGKRTFPWASTHSQGADEVFLSSRTENYRAAVIDVQVNRTGVEETIQAAGFQCWVVGASRAGSAFELEADIAATGVDQIEEEQEALRAIHAECCSKKGSCKYWPQKVSGKPGELEFDLCHVRGNICDGRGRLTRLNLDHYDMVCDLPSKILTTFVDLKKLEAGHNRFTGNVAVVMDDLANLANLTHIGLPQNRLTGTLASSRGLCEMAASRLLFLNLQVNHVEGTVPECLISSGSKLLDVVLSRTDIAGTLPDVFSSDSDLQAFVATSTQLYGEVPSSLANAKQLTYLGLGHNKFKGRFPEGLDVLPNIHTLGLRDNKISALPKSWKDPKKVTSKTLKFVDFGHNKLEGEFPMALATSGHLDVLDLSKNKLQGGLPDAPVVFPNVTYLKLAGNKFTGPIPDSWAEMGMFQQPAAIAGRIDLRNNKGLAGELPDFFYPNELEGKIAAVRIEKTGLSCNRRGPSPFVLDLEVCKGDPTAVGA